MQFFSKINSYLLTLGLLVESLRHYSGSDGKVRVVDVQTKSGVYHRPIVKLVLLLSEINDNYLSSLGRKCWSQTKNLTNQQIDTIFTHYNSPLPASLAALGQLVVQLKGLLPVSLSNVFVIYYSTLKIFDSYQLWLTHNYPIVED